MIPETDWQNQSEAAAKMADEYMAELLKLGPVNFPEAVLAALRRSYVDGYRKAQEVFQGWFPTPEEDARD